MATKIEAYVDTSALIAFADQSDTYHKLFRRLFSNPPPLITTSLVIAEGHGWFIKRYDRTKALHFMAMIEAMKPLKVLSTGAREVIEATNILRQFSDQDLTLVDACGLYVMQKKRCSHCWSTDFHLSITGVSLVIHEQ